MRIRSTLVGAIALAGLAAAPRAAHAVTLPICSPFSAVLGLGGSLNGCFSGTVARLGEDAFLNSTAMYFMNNPNATTPETGVPDGGGFLNSPIAGGTTLFTTDCGSGGAGVFTFCSNPMTTAISNLQGEAVFALKTPDAIPAYNNIGYYSYTGDQSRNAVPAPPGYQAVLLQVTGGGAADANHYLLGWEDLNTGCTNKALFPSTIDISKLSDGAYLNSDLANCGASGTSDSDYNDIYFDIHLSSVGVPTDNPVPEPMTMSMMAFGLVAMGGASFRRRKNSK